MADCDYLEKYKDFERREYVVATEDILSGRIRKGDSGPINAIVRMNRSKDVYITVTWERPGKDPWPVEVDGLLFGTLIVKKQREPETQPAEDDTRIEYNTQF